jgi:hypothetical protein
MLDLFRHFYLYLTLGPPSNKQKIIQLPFPDEKSDGRDERDDPDEGGEVAGTRVLVHHANLLSFRL